MKVTQEKLPASQIGLEIEIPSEMSKQAYEKTLQEFTRLANIPGFRKGKVPRQVLIQRFGSKRLKAATLEDLIQNSLKQAVEQEKLETLGGFELRPSFDELIAQFEPGSALTFSAAIDVPPQAELDQYAGLQVQAEEVTYDPEQVDRVLEDYRKRSATLVPVEGRSAQTGDISTIDFSGTFTKAEGEEPSEIQGGSAQDFELELVEGRFIPGFVDGVLDMNPGETKDVALTFPEDYPQPDLAGKPAVFTITLKELKERELPELDDDFAQEVSDFETLAELRESLETRFQKEAETKTKNNKQEALLNELVKHLEVELPETLIKQETDFSITQTAMRLGEQGLDIRKTFTSEIVEALRQQARPESIERLRRTLALAEVTKRESIAVEPETVATKVQEILEEYAGQQVDIERLKQVVEEDLLKDKILSWLEEHGTVELVPEGTLTPPEPEPELVNVEAESAEALAPAEAAGDATIDVEAATVTDAEEAVANVEATAETAADAEEPDAEVEAAEEPVDPPARTKKS